MRERLEGKPSEWESLAQTWITAYINVNVN